MRNVLILTRSPDPHMPPVAEAIRARGSGVICFNLADFPVEVALQATLDGRQDGWSGSISYQEQHVPLDSLTSIWWRRPKQYKAPAVYSPGERTFLEEETNRGIIGVLESLALQQTLWVSRLHSIRRAELKPLQLAAAQQLGLRTPRPAPFMSCARDRWSSRRSPEGRLRRKKDASFTPAVCCRNILPR
jgi:hypothetical protein